MRAYFSVSVFTISVYYTCQYSQWVVCVGSLQQQVWRTRLEATEDCLIDPDPVAAKGQGVTECSW